MQEGRAAYAPPSAVTSVIDRARNGTLPSTIDTDSLQRIGVPESLGPRTLSSLKMLGLVSEDGAAGPALAEFAEANSADYTGIVERWLRSTYSDVFEVLPALSGCTYENVEDAFRGYTPAGQRARMVTLFIGLCDFAGLLPDDSPLRSSFRSTRREPSKSKHSPQTRKAAAAIASSPRKERASRDRPDQRISKGEMLDALKDREVRLDPMILGLVQRLPPVDSAWPEVKREAWLNAARASFDVLYTLPDDDQAG